MGFRTGWPDFPRHSGQPANPCRFSCRYGSYSSSTGMVRRHGVSIAVLCRIILATKNRRCSSGRDAFTKPSRSRSVAARLAPRLTSRIARKCKIPRRYGGFRSRPRGTRTRNLRIKSPAEGVRLIVRSLVSCGFVSVSWWGVVANSAPLAPRFAPQSRPVVVAADCVPVVFVGLVVVWVGKPVLSLEWFR